MGASGTSRWAVPLLGATAGIAMADPNIASTALVEAVRGLHSPTVWIPVAASMENYATAATVISTGLLADRLGRKRLLSAALVLLVCSELMTAAAPNTWVFMTGRAVTGIAGGAVFGASFAFVRAVAPGNRLGSALGVFGASAAVMALVAGVLGGGAASISWRVAFLVVPALAAIAVILMQRMLPTIPAIGSSMVDPLGQVLLGIAVLAPLYALSRADTWGPGVWVPALIGVTAGVAFWLVERSAKNPLIPQSVLRSRVYWATALLGLIWNAAMAILLLQLANMWQYLDDWSTLKVAVASMPAALAGIAASMVMGRRISAGLTPRTAAMLGVAGIVAGFALLAVYRPGASYWLFLPAIMLVGAGAQAVNVPYGALIVAEAPPDRFGPVTSSRVTFGQIGYAVGLAGATVLVDQVTDHGLIAQLRRAGLSAERISESLSVVSQFVAGDGASSDPFARQALVTAASSYSHAFSLTMAAAAVSITVMAVLSWWMLRPVPAQQ